MSPNNDLLFAVRLWQAGHISAEQLARSCEQPQTPLSSLLAQSDGITPGDQDSLAPGATPSRSEEEPTGRPFRHALAALAESAATSPGPAPDATDPVVGVRGSGLQASRYTLLREEGKGGMGRVFLAHDRVLQREVALKELLPGRGAAEMVRRFHNEARITARLQHPGVVPVYDLVSLDGALFYTMKFVRGTTLHKAAEEFHKAGRPAATFRGLLAAFVSLCRTMAYAHSRGVIHCDLKGANVILGDYGEVLVLDWGLAKECAPLTPQPPLPTRGEGAGRRPCSPLSPEGGRGGPGG